MRKHTHFYDDRQCIFEIIPEKVICSTESHNPPLTPIVNLMIFVLWGTILYYTYHYSLLILFDKIKYLLPDRIIRMLIHQLSGNQLSFL